LRYLIEERLLAMDWRELPRGTDLVAIELQVVVLLVYLIQDRDRVVSKYDLRASVWHGRAISKSALFNRINAASSAIDDTGERHGPNMTLSRGGLRFVGAVREEEASLV
jgi:DNA-binding winged helix-turn-helix (wHTH) protein